MENTAPNTNNFLNWVEIKNFKSIKDLRLDCKRVNVFIGKPNVGKSNILEGLGLLGAGYDSGKFLKGAARYKQMNDFFLDKDLRNAVTIVTDKRVAVIGEGFGITAFNDANEEISKVVNFEICAFELEEFIQITSSDQANLLLYRAKARRGVNEVGNVNRNVKVDTSALESKLNDALRIVKKYDFANLTQFESSFESFLRPPNGNNLYAVIRRNPELWAEFSKLFTEQQLEFVLYDEKQEFILQKRNGPFVIQYPFFSIADTFRRFMFYITAIESNKDSVIVLEEPEVHSFPPYVKTLAHRIVDSDTNQFFLSTHSPYLLQTLIRELDSTDLSVFITYYKDYQTCVRALTPEELQEAEDLSIDLFYNLNRYEPNA
ncbi:AAA family ATPase [Spirosoma sp. KCTC 42546]|uniref:AAA family ATPase n=1 Tax=Spirosoma sp. KCTC 42546 TaxID=2520506 RepID=UPI0011572876|nr:AAA family ATPase [Spirosoma sp. KCTC 42546]QDK79334.1 AAA family ATPase [Spirosoma sp. KCTC 42546]